MEKQQLSRLKQQLLKEKQMIEQQVADTEPFETTELSSYDNHPADMVSDLTDQLTDMALDEFNEGNLEKINDALRAMEEGRYGICSVCQGEIPFERLEAIPTTLTCVHHAEQQVETLVASEQQVLEEIPRGSFDGEEQVDEASSDSPTDKEQ